MKFKIGEIAILVNANNSRHLIGTEVTIIAAGKFSHGDYSHFIGGFLQISKLRVADYAIQDVTGRISYCAESWLRKRRDFGIPKEIKKIFEAPVNA